MADAAPRKDAYTVYADDGYYSETTYFLTEESYQSVTAQAPQQNTGAQKLSAKTEQPSNFVMAVEKKVWVEETVNAHGVVDSRLLKKAEIEENQVIENEAYAVPTAVTANPSEVGRANTSKYALRISMYVAEVNGEYTTTGMAWWEHELGTNEETAEISARDYIALTWGGRDTLQSNQPRFYAYDYDGDEIIGSLCYSDPYAGYVWDFDEKTALGADNIAKYIEVSNTISKGFGEILGETTYTRLTYRHYFKERHPSITLEIDEDGKLAASVTFSTVENSWEIMIAVPGIVY